MPRSCRALGISGQIVAYFGWSKTHQSSIGAWRTFSFPDKTKLLAKAAHMKNFALKCIKNERFAMR